jgi:hypothetical protein
MAINVSAGEDQTKSRELPITVFTLAGVTNGDTYEWSIVAGDLVTIVDPTALDTEVVFSDVGDVTLQLSATNIDGTATDEVYLEVTAWPSIPEWPIPEAIEGATLRALDLHYGKLHLKQGFD